MWKTDEVRELAPVWVTGASWNRQIYFAKFVWFCRSIGDRQFWVGSRFQNSPTILYFGKEQSNASFPAIRWVWQLENKAKKIDSQFSAKFEISCRTGSSDDALKYREPRKLAPFDWKTPDMREKRHSPAVEDIIPLQNANRGVKPSLEELLT